MLIDTFLRASIQFHDVLHGFQDGRGMGMATMDLKLAQELACVDHNPLFQVFLDLRKAYRKKYKYRLIQTLEGYGAGPCMC